MIQIDMKMPEHCVDCPYSLDNCCLVLGKYIPLKQWAKGGRQKWCPLKEQEVKTGYWIDSAGNDKCSICGEEYSDLYPDYGNTHFCPNCGAKMKGR